jgi:tetratricopeptide (TPR) repeat protein
MQKIPLRASLLFYTCLLLASCSNNNTTVSDTDLKIRSLKRGEIVSCGPPNKEFGSIGFETSLSGEAKKDFDLAIALLHSFEYDEAEKMFATVIDEEPQYPMAYWGVAMSNYHPLWAPPNQQELEKGSKAVTIAQSLKQKSKRESDYIEAIAAFYKDWETTDHRTRTTRFEKAMEKIYSSFPNDKEAAIFYALALTASADPADKTYSNQKKAGSILNALYPGQPNHPGIVHYIIHAYDSPELAELGLDAARKYASVAPSSAHALHMPSHIFTRLGLWDECINSNLTAVSSAQCYAQQTGIKGHWDEELHGLDYLVYAYLQKGDNKSAKQQVDYVQTISDVSPINFKVAYAFAAIPSRYFLENKMWEEAANLKFHPANFPWNDYPWQKAIVHFTRLMGCVNTGKSNLAQTELKELNRLHNKLIEQKDAYKANEVQIQIKTAEAWMRFKEGKNNEALMLMNNAADMEDQREKHSVTPGEVIPAREFLADMLLQMKMPAKALTAYEAVLKKNRKRLNSLYSAAVAAEMSNNVEKANQYYKQLNEMANSPNADMRRFEKVKLYMKEKNS